MAAHRETYKKQSGGRGKFGDIVFELLSPADDDFEGEGSQSVEEIKGGNVFHENIFHQLKRICKDAMQNGFFSWF